MKDTPPEDRWQPTNRDNQLKVDRVIRKLVGLQFQEPEEEFQQIKLSAEARKKMEQDLIPLNKKRRKQGLDEFAVYQDEVKASKFFPKYKPTPLEGVPKLTPPKDDHDETD